MIFGSRFFALSILALSLTTAPAQAQALRTWVSGLGDDVNPCSRTAPCKTFAGAISKTAAGGEISVLDAGGFGQVTITKSISITNNFVNAGILAPSGAGILVRAGATDVVRIRGLVIDGANGTQGSAGIRFQSGAELHVEQCLIKNFRLESAGHGIDFTPQAGGVLYVSDTVVTRNAGGGIRVAPTNTGTTKAVLNRVQSTSNSVGMRIDGTTSTGAIFFAAHDSVMATNITKGLSAVTNASGATLTVQSDQNLIVNNPEGVSADGANANIVLSGTTVMGNAVGVTSPNGGGLFSFKNNSINGNVTTNGTIPPGNILTQN